MSTTPLPDLLHLDERVPPDEVLLEDLLGLAFMGSNVTAKIHDTLNAGKVAGSSWRQELYASEVFLRDFIDSCGTLRFGTDEYVAHGDFLFRALSEPPTDVPTIEFRQEILRELESNDELRDRTEGLYRELVHLLDLIKAAHTRRNVDPTPDRLRVLAQIERVLRLMDENFGAATSGLRRIHDSGAAIRKSRHYRTLVDLLAYEDKLASLRVSMRLGADGRIKTLQIDDFEELRDNRFYKSPLRRWREMVGLLWRGYPMSAREIANRVIVDVYMKIAPALARVTVLVGHLEVYLTARAFADNARQRGLDVCLAEVRERGPLRHERLFNPLLLAQASPPVPCDVVNEAPESITIVTGPNSGGKTRLLQGLGLAQLLGQSGLYVPAAASTVPVAHGLLASIVETASADQLEGRLGTELLRIRTLFEHIRPGSMVVLDELCSGTNPSEAAEIVLMVLRLLGRLQPRAFITTHFLDLARQLAAEREIPGVDFLQVEMAGERSTYQFVPGVANTSMAAETARRLGVDFERLDDEIRARLDDEVERLAPESAGS